MSRRASLLRRGLAALTALALAATVAGNVAGQTGAKGGKKKSEPPQVELVFVVDTTGSMGGLLNAAKQKIWFICNQIASSHPTPNLKIGLVAFRDRGDEYVTRVYGLTDDLDAVHGHLMSFVAKGGGDFPESVNEALHVAVTKIKWSEDKQTLKLIFLVGDAPPHMDYSDDVKYPDSCKLAKDKGILVNTIQCGNHPDTAKYWKHICELGGGKYVQIGADGGPVITVETPFDKELVKINAELTKRTLVYGDEKRQAAGLLQNEANLKLAPPIAADRAAYYGNAMKGASYDLLENIKNKTVKLEEIKKEHLPAELRNLTLEEQRAYLVKLDKERQDLNTKARELDKKRMTFLAQKQAEEEKKRGAETFEMQVLQLLQTQGRRLDMDLTAPREK
jgi:Mg-chelatase subunit ChlD